MEGLFMQLSEKEKKKNDPHDWFCGPGSHISCTIPFKSCNNLYLFIYSFWKKSYHLFDQKYSKSSYTVKYYNSTILFEYIYNCNLFLLSIIK